MQRARLVLLSLSLSLAACGGSAGTDAGQPPADAGPGTDSGSGDAGTPIDGGAPAMDGGSTTDGGPMLDAGPMADGGSASSCGTARPDVSGITGTEGLVIARDGTIYYSQRGAVGRLRPGGTPENAFVSAGGAASTVWGLALDAANETLFVGVPGMGVMRVDLTAATPSATMLVTGGSPNGLTMGPDGFLYYSDFSAGRVYRVEPVSGGRTEVTASRIMQANGLIFEPAGTLLVASYGTGVLYRLTLTANVESAREMVAMGLGSTDGVTLAADGSILVTNQADSAVIRITGTTQAFVGPSIPGLANLEHGTGALRCDDLYVTSSGAMRRIEGVGNGAALLWH